MTRTTVDVLYICLLKVLLCCWHQEDLKLQPEFQNKLQDLTLKWLIFLIIKWFPTRAHCSRGNFLLLILKRTSWVLFNCC